MSEELSGIGRPDIRRPVPARRSVGYSSPCFDLAFLLPHRRWNPQLLVVDRRTKALSAHSSSIGGAHDTRRLAGVRRSGWKLSRSGLGPPLIVLHDQQPAAAIDTVDLDLATWRACVGSHHSSSTGQGPAHASTGNSSDSSPTLAIAGAAGHRPRCVTHRPAVLTQHNRRQWRGEDPAGAAAEWCLATAAVDCASTSAAHPGLRTWRSRDFARLAAREQIPPQDRACPAVERFPARHVVQRIPPQALT